jgi:hypothetical protein
MLPNAFGDGEMTLWFHLVCAAYKRPQSLLEALEARVEPLDDREQLMAAARQGIAHRRLPRINGAERDPSGRAHCRSCKGTIAKQTWRITLVYFEEGRFMPSGAIHARCAQAYLETTDVAARLRHFSPTLREDDLEAIQAELHGESPGTSA